MWHRTQFRKIFDSDRVASSVILVVAPHPDDDVIGCGGTLSRAVSRGADVRVVYVTDGSASHVRSKRFPPATLARIREREATSALRAIGVKRRPIFLRAPDGSLASLPEPETARLVASVAGVLRRSDPDVVFSPWKRDPHADHVATADIVARALRGAAGAPRVLSYTVWLDAPGMPANLPAAGEATTVEVSLSDVEVAKKRNAILQHLSQTTGLIDDDPDGFRIGPELLEAWLRPVERFFCASGAGAAR